MSKQSFKRSLGFILCLALFALTGWLGISKGLGDFAGSTSFLQLVCSAAVTLYGVFGIAAGAGLLLRRRFSVVATILWGCALVAAAVTAPPAWAPGETPWWGVLLGGGATAGIVIGVLRIVRALLPRAEVVTSATGSESKGVDARPE